MMYDQPTKAVLGLDLELFVQFHRGVCENRTTYLFKTLM